MSNIEESVIFVCNFERLQTFVTLTTIFQTIASLQNASHKISNRNTYLHLATKPEAWPKSFGIRQNSKRELDQL